MQQRFRVLILFITCLPSLGFADENIDLINQMGHFQYFLHKTHLSLLNNNLELAKFYAHEIEETLNNVRKVKKYDGYPISKLAEKTLLPAIKNLKKTLSGKSLVNAHKSLDFVIEACNRCHKATKHAYIRIERRDANPYFQSFSRKP